MDLGSLFPLPGSVPPCTDLISTVAQRPRFLWEVALQNKGGLARMLQIFQGAYGGKDVFSPLFFIRAKFNLITLCRGKSKSFLYYACPRLPNAPPPLLWRGTQKRTLCCLVGKMTGLCVSDCSISFPFSFQGNKNRRGRKWG